MDQATLVESDIVLGARVLDALSHTRMPVAFFGWHYATQLDEWQLLIATPWYETKGPRKAWSALVDALQKAHVYEHVPTRRVFLKDPKDPLVVQESHQERQGFVHVLRQRVAAQDAYSVIFAPITGGGGPVPAKQFPDKDELEAFLTDQLGIRRSSVDEALIEVDRKGTSSIFPVNLSVRELKKAGLIAA